MSDVAAPPKVIDRKRLKRDLEELAKVSAKIVSDKTRAFAKEHEIDLPIPGLLLSQGLRSLLLSRVEQILDLPEADLRNVLKLIEYQVGVALGEKDPSVQPFRHPAVHASIDRLLNMLVKGGALSAAELEQEPEPTV